MVESYDETRFPRDCPVGDSGRLGGVVDAYQRLGPHDHYTITEHNDIAKETDLHGAFADYDRCTSLLTNRDDRPWKGWNGRDGDPLPDSDQVDRWLEQADPVTASAATNTSHGIDIGSSDRVCFLHSDIPEGRFCSERLQRFYSDVVQCREVEGHSLTALGYACELSQKGLIILVNETIVAVRRARDRSFEPVFCATGGFKAEIASQP